MEKKTLGIIISSARKDLELTQMQLADKMNVTDKAVSKWERDLSCPDINSLSKLATILGITIEELMQAKKQEVTENNIEKIKKLIPLILTTVALAMGIAVAVLSILGEIDGNASVFMLGLGLACLAINALDEKTNKGA